MAVQNLSSNHRGLKVDCMGCSPSGSSGLLVLVNANHSQKILCNVGFPLLFPCFLVFFPKYPLMQLKKKSSHHFQLFFFSTFGRSLACCTVPFSEIIYIHVKNSDCANISSLKLSWLCWGVDIAAKIS